MPRTALPWAASLAWLLSMQTCTRSAWGMTCAVPSDYLTIAEALQAAQAGDTVLVSCGAYAEIELSMKSGIVLRGSSGSAACVTIDGEHSGGTILHCENLTGDTRIEGITFANGGGAHSPLFDAGGLRIHDSLVNFESCDFVDNEAEDGGGAIHCTGSTLALSNCRFLSNQADWDDQATADGGAIRAHASNLELNECRFEGNSAMVEGLGSAVWLSASQLVATNCEFLDNFTGGGSAALYTRSGCGAALIRPRFERNQALFGSGSLSVGDDCHVSVDQGIFLENRGGIAADEIFVSNTGSLQMTGTVLIAEATAATYGPLLDVDHPGGVLALENCLIVLGPYDTISDCTYGEIDFQCSDVWSASGAVWVDCYADQLGVNGNFSADPQFCGEAGSGNYYLQSDSPCAPANNSCGELIGALPVGCEVVATQETSISAIKSLY
jgi:predicted outer membrane repeat protein